ncbi:MAG: right-handed parallel beta-helix repeat-containing protein [Deltaproteobacteria bacterium]|nr:right-handed parallel beta-helix repeat-containing protein [Deltaproteobacteria bacterium]
MDSYRKGGHLLGLGIGLGLALSLAPITATAAETELGPQDDIEAAIGQMSPGDVLVLQGGMYLLEGRFGIDNAGTEQAPIVIRAKEGEVPHFHRPNANQNIIDFDSAAYMEIIGIEFSGGSAGLRLSDVSDLTIRDCEIHDTGDVALRANDGGVTYERLHLVHNHIHHTNDTGEGMYLGCNNDGCRMADSIIELNYIHHTNQPSVQQGDGIEIKEGSYGNIVRDNVIHDTNYPCVLTYSAANNGPANIIERNVMWNCGDHAIQSAADTIIRNNIILGSNADGIAMQSHQSGAPANLEVVHNTIFHASNDAIAVRDVVGSVVIANNAVFAQGGSAINLVSGDTNQVVVAGNVGQGGLAGAGAGYTDGDITQDFVDAHYGGMPPIDVFPTQGALVGAGDPAYALEDDFNALPREGSVDVGAYAFDPEGNPGWALAAEFKEFPDGADPGGDTGDSGDSGDDGSGGTGGETGSGSAGDGDDMGATGADGDGSGTGGALPDPSGGGGGADDEGGGCGCRSGGTTGTGAMFLLGALGLSLTRRRRNVSSQV